MKLLVTGGAGYIGSHMVRHALELSHDVVVLDDFSKGHKWAVQGCEILNVNLLNKEKLSQLLNKRYFDGVIHFAAMSLVSESITNPLKYYHNNLVSTLNLISEMLNNNIDNFVFSSTAAIFGNPQTDKIKENHPKNPINPYGQSKLMIENILYDVCKTRNLNAICFRYFNAAGAHHSGEIGEAHDPETHLIPNIIRSILYKEEILKVFGNDYDTHDGTCIRDYVHVSDLASAHMFGLNYLQKNKGFSSFNLGNGDGFSVLDVIASCERAMNKSIPYVFNQRREGDPAKLVADCEKAMNILGWQPKFNSLDSIVPSALKWHKYYQERF